MKFKWFPLCLIGLSIVVKSVLQSRPNKYVLVNSTMTWSAAQDYCTKMFANPAIILSETDLQRLNELMVSKGMATYAWVGLHNEINSWRWSLNELPMSKVTFQNWGPGQPDNNAGKEACGLIDDKKRWWDAECALLKTFICYNANYAGAARFIAVTSPMMNWSDAQTYCRTHHTDLASSLSSSDNDILGQMVTFSVNPWFGLYRNTWMWSDEIQARGIPWASGQPDNYGGNENCAVIYNGLHDVPCSNQYYFYCQLPVRKQQVVRVQVKSDGSVLDPTVQMSIEEQIKRNLKEKGMLKNTTVTWRVQPDGNIFYKKTKDEL